MKKQKQINNSVNRRQLQPFTQWNSCFLFAFATNTMTIWHIESSSDRKHKYKIRSLIFESLSLTCVTSAFVSGVVLSWNTFRNSRGLVDASQNSLADIMNCCTSCRHCSAQSTDIEHRSMRCDARSSTPRAHQLFAYMRYGERVYIQAFYYESCDDDDHEQHVIALTFSTRSIKSRFFISVSNRRVNRSLTISHTRANSSHFGCTTSFGHAPCTLTNC